MSFTSRVRNFFKKTTVTTPTYVKPEVGAYYTVKLSDGTLNILVVRYALKNGDIHIEYLDGSKYIVDWTKLFLEMGAEPMVEGSAKYQEHYDAIFGSKKAAA